MNKYKSEYIVRNEEINSSAIDILRCRKEQNYLDAVRELYQKGVESFRAYCRIIDTTKDWDGACEFSEYTSLLERGISVLRWEFLYFEHEVKERP